ncbi:MAG: methyltransferase domain-containing protein [Planctomycetales bacterium]|nr:methyltransferase domain-containing protein [Planctomycetales bacterium]
MDTKADNLDVESAVRERYSSASRAAEASLCCPVNYDTQYLEAIPAEIIERDYGCGNPARDVRPGETILDLGSGGGKICYIAAQIVGAEGRVLGVDMNDDMLDLARRHRQDMADKLGYDNVEFFKGRIQDLALDLERFEEQLRSNPVDSTARWFEAEGIADSLRRNSPMIASDSVDVVISNCVLNLVRESDRRQLFQEIFRVLNRGGRAVISDIVCDEPVPQHLRDDPKLWSGCISGAFVEHEFLQAFEQAGFYGIEIVERQQDPWAVVEGIEFRSVTVRAFKGKQGPCLDHHQAVIYRGPWKSVTDDDGHVLRRGERMAVCEKTFRLYSTEPYADSILPVPPVTPVAASDAEEFDCHGGAARDPQITKQRPDKSLDILPGSCCCGPGEC